jgi:hypothetical protein
VKPVPQIISANIVCDDTVRHELEINTVPVTGIELLYRDVIS